MKYKLTWKKNKLQLTKPFVLSYGVFHHRFSYIVKLEVDGIVGYGEAAAISYYGWSEELIEEQLNTLPEEIEKDALFSIAHSFCAPLQHACTAAYFDLDAKQHGQALSEYFGFGTLPMDRHSSLTISGNTFDEFVEQIDQYDWPAFKIKMGTDHDDVQLDVIRNYRHKRFRIDANGGWTIDWIRRHADQLNQENIELIEQPFPVGQDEDVLVLKEILSKPIFADESCQTVQDVEKCANGYDGINIKLMKMGGWCPVLDIMKMAERYGLELMVGCMTESSIGISHSGQLLSKISIVDLDGSTLISNDPAAGLKLDKGRVIFPDRDGCGAILKET